MSEVTALADEYWAFFRRTEQLENIERGDVDQIREWEDLSPSGVADRVQRLREFKERAESLDSTDDEDAVMLATIAFSAGGRGIEAAVEPGPRSRQRSDGLRVGSPGVRAALRADHS